MREEAEKVAKEAIESAIETAKAKVEAKVEAKTKAKAKAKAKGESKKQAKSEQKETTPVDPLDSGFEKQWSDTQKASQKLKDMVPTTTEPATGEAKFYAQTEKGFVSNGEDIAKEAEKEWVIVQEPSPADLQQVENAQAVEPVQASVDTAPAPVETAQAVVPAPAPVETAEAVVPAQAPASKKITVKEDTGICAACVVM